MQRFTSFLRTLESSYIRWLWMRDQFWHDEKVTFYDFINLDVFVKSLLFTTKIMKNMKEQKKEVLTLLEPKKEFYATKVVFFAVGGAGRIYALLSLFRQG